MQAIWHKRALSSLRIALGGDAEEILSGQNVVRASVRVGVLLSLRVHCPPSDEEVTRLGLRTRRT
ncbi:MAG: hypothetical protein ACI8W8_000127 [Rhodothermales bacterium]|jgi:hypothetical protein